MIEKMTYEEALNFISEAEKNGIVLGLDNMKRLLLELDHPEKGQKIIHIAGTNGKGSILAFISTILLEAGYKVGCYISPTIFDYLERFQINGIEVTEGEFASATHEVKLAVEQILKSGGAFPTAFEIETAIAIVLFRKTNCDVVILETGMGGDTDATNAVETKELEVFGRIGIDHVKFLGTTIEEITEHKAGIIKEDSLVVSAPQLPEVAEILKAVAASKNTDITFVDESLITVKKRSLQEGQVFSYGVLENLKTGLLGTYQIENAAVAVEAILTLREKGYDISDEDIRRGLFNTIWPGRFDLISTEPLVLLDGAHNRDGALALKDSVDFYLSGKKIHAICATFKDKEYKFLLNQMAPYIFDMIAIETPDNLRSLSAGELAEVATKEGIDVMVCDNIEEAVKIAVKRAKNDGGTVLCFGTLSILGDVYTTVKNMQKISK